MHFTVILAVLLRCVKPKSATMTPIKKLEISHLILYNARKHGNG